MKPSLSILGSLAVVCSTLAHADSGRIPVWQATVITAPGHYVVTRDFSGSGNVVWIQSPDVVLDLNGHTITAASVGDRGVYVTPSSGSQGLVEIRNGRLRGGAACVAYVGNPASDKMTLRLERLDASTPGGQPVTVSGAQAVEILGCNVHDSPGANVAIFATSGDSSSFTGLIEGNTLRSIGGGGIQLHSMSGGAVRKNVLLGFGTTTFGIGISFEGPSTVSGGVRIEGNTIRNGGGSTTGMTIYGGPNRNAVVANVIEGVSGEGLVVSSNGNRIAENVLGYAGGNGTTINGNDNTFERNLVESGGAHGVVVYGSYNLIDGNTSEGHANYGLAFLGAANAYRGNMLRNNLSGALFGSATDAGGNIY